MSKSKRTWIFSFIIMGVLLTLISSCKKDEDNNKVATVTTSGVLKVTDNSATVSGNISSDGGADIMARGVCWCTSTGPDLADNATVNGANVGDFTSELSGLQPNTTYYVRVYATNSVGTSYGNEIVFTTPATVTDVDGNVYHTVIIGDQVWMAENLKVTHYRNGDAIPDVTGANEWISLNSGAYCSCGKAKYGLIYNGYVILDARHIAPAGWHVPTDLEWKILEGTVDSQYPVGDPVWDGTELRGSDVGGNLKSTTNDWDTPNLGAKDTRGFAALPGGYRHWDTGQFLDVNGGAYWGTSTEYDASQMWARGISNNDTRMWRTFNSKRTGGSIRCIKD